MPWQCKACNAVCYNSLSQCVICWERDSFVSKRPEGAEWIDELEIDKLKVLIWSLEASEIKMGMNPNEEKFARFFNDEKALISSMDDLQLKAHRDELQAVASEARARLTAIVAEVGEREAKKRNKGINVIVDPDGTLATEAINNIKKQQGKMTKQEKQIKNLVDKLGISQEEAENMFKAANILAIKNKKTEEVKPMNTTDMLSAIMGTAPITETPAEIKEIVNIEEPKESKSTISNPFAK